MQKTPITTKEMKPTHRFVDINTSCVNILSENNRDFQLEAPVRTISTSPSSLIEPTSPEVDHPASPVSCIFVPNGGGRTRSKGSILDVTVPSPDGRASRKGILTFSSSVGSLPRAKADRYCDFIKGDSKSTDSPPKRPQRPRSSI